MRFSTLAHLLDDKYRGHTTTCLCGVRGGSHDRCRDRMPYNWVIPHCSRFSLRMLQKKTNVNDPPAMEDFPPPVNFQGGVDYPDFWWWPMTYGTYWFPAF